MIVDEISTYMVYKYTYMSVILHKIGIFVECILFSYEEINYAMFVKREGRIQDFYFMVRTPEAHEAPEFFSASLLTLARAHLIDSKLFNIIPYIFIQVRLLNSAKGSGQFMVRRTVRIPLNTPMYKEILFTKPCWQFSDCTSYFSRD